MHEKKESSCDISDIFGTINSIYKQVSATWFVIQNCSLKFSICQNDYSGDPLQFSSSLPRNVKCGETDQGNTDQPVEKLRNPGKCQMLRNSCGWAKFHCHWLPPGDITIAAKLLCEWLCNCVFFHFNYEHRFIEKGSWSILTGIKPYKTKDFSWTYGRYIAK